MKSYGFGSNGEQLPVLGGRLEILNPRERCPVVQLSTFHSELFGVCLERFHRVRSAPLRPIFSAGRHGECFEATSGRWRKRMGIEPTLRAATARSNGFEDRESHQAPCASGPSLTPALSRSLRLAEEVRRDSRGGTSSGCWSLTWPGGGPQSPRAVARKEKPSGGEFTSPERGGFGGHFCGGEKGGEPQSPPQ